MTEDSLWDWYSGKRVAAVRNAPTTRPTLPLPLVAIALAMAAQFSWQFGPRDLWQAGATLYLLAATLFG
ncbi:MAG: hypothetical protein DWI61_07410, partial [Chloroflexi bacterium]